MRDYKDRAVEGLRWIIERLKNQGWLLNREIGDYQSILKNYDECREQELLARKEQTPYTSYSNCVILRSKEDGEITVKSYPNDMANVMMRDVSEVICFSDCDDMWDVLTIIYRGREVEYDGWAPGMVMSYSFKETGDEAWSGVFENWDH